MLVSSFSRISVFSVAVCFIAGCAASGGGGSSNNGGLETYDKKPAEIDPRALAQMDVSALTQQQAWQVSAYDAEKRQIFSKIFGGQSGTIVRGYLDQRLKYYLSEAEVEALANQMDPSKLRIPGQTNNPREPEPEKKGITMAANYGALFFLFGAIHNSVLQANHNGTRIVFDSPRAGLMMMGEGYVAHEEYRGKWFKIPSSYRQATLVHEARHSDCTKGVSQNSLHQIRNSRSNADFNRALQSTECSHFHSTCPIGHKLSGVAACDDHAWGPYAIDAVFSAARARGASGVEQALLEASAADAASRMAGSITMSGLLAGVHGEPDMSSARPDVFSRSSR